MSSFQDTLNQFSEYLKGISSNEHSARAADRFVELVAEQKLGRCTTDVSWSVNGGTSISCVCKLTNEARIRGLLHTAADAVGLSLEAPIREDNLADLGSIFIRYGPLTLRLAPDGVVCRRVKVGTRTEPAREVDVFEIQCTEEAVAP